MSGSTRVLVPGAAAAAVGLVVLVAFAGPAGSQGYSGPGKHYGGQRYVVAESQWGNGTVSGPIRPSRHGWQVRMPRGTWIDCVRSCSETLRRATVDFWQTVGPNAPDAGPGYFRWEFRY